MLLMKTANRARCSGVLTPIVFRSDPAYEPGRKCASIVRQPIKISTEKPRVDERSLGRTVKRWPEPSSLDTPVSITPKRSLSCCESRLASSNVLVLVTGQIWFGQVFDEFAQ